MIVSMTGYAKVKGSFGTKEITVEIKSLNSKYPDLRVKIPFAYREKEIELRKMVQERIQRGKIEMNILLNGSSDESFSINRPLFRQFYNQLSEISRELGAQSPDFIPSIMRIPNVVTVADEDILPAEWEAVSALVQQACSLLLEHMVEEGRALEIDMEERVQAIIALLQQIEPLEETRIQAIRTRLNKDLNDLINDVKFDKNRFEQEILYYLEKLDFTEEKVRLTQHAQYFHDVLAQNEVLKGRKLGFITQEMGREINTLGAKAQHPEIQRYVVQMKDELEKIKEQLANIM
ncbi:MAG: YicC family protein [Saprospiraceae bacterium]|nr:YicC family protein [Saprospiraceae bacterium]MCB9321885.1 YicC family protein [Lewinellaceae bacterium]